MSTISSFAGKIYNELKYNSKFDYQNLFDIIAIVQLIDMIDYYKRKDSEFDSYNIEFIVDKIVNDNALLIE